MFRKNFELIRHTIDKPCFQMCYSLIIGIVKYNELKERSNGRSTGMDGVVIELNKLERQIILYQYFNSPVIKGKLDQEELYGIPISTIYKDMRDLRDAGLIYIKWKNGKGGEEGQYVTIYQDQEDEDHAKIKSYDETKDSPTRVRHLRRLKRICQSLTQLRNDELHVDYIDGKIIRGNTCKQ